MLKQDPKYGYFPRWPEDGNEWLHPDDVQLARQMIPSFRIFKREGQKKDGEPKEFVELHYGKQVIRARRRLWIDVRFEGLNIGDWVEVKAQIFKLTPRTGWIRDMLFEPDEQRIQYFITESDGPIPTTYYAEDLQPVDPTKPNPKEARIEPSGEKGFDLADE